MKLERAIEILSDSANRGITTFNADYKEAQKLGIEALKWRRLMEHDYGSWCGPPLPGEPEEAPHLAHFHTPDQADVDKRGTK